ncbi:hypothetical protein HKD37_11G031705 [Glycine soja]
MVITLKTMDEHQQNCKKRVNTMMKINKKTEEIEVSRSFAIRWKDELESTSHLLHSSGTMHSVTYNQDLVTLTHYAQSVFLLIIFKSTFEPKAYPNWHSLYHKFLTQSLLKSC